MRRRAENSTADIMTLDDCQVGLAALANPRQGSRASEI